MYFDKLLRTHWYWQDLAQEIAKWHLSSVEALPSSKFLKEKDRNKLNRNQNEVFLKPNCLVQISCKSDHKFESYWRLKI